MLANKREAFAFGKGAFESGNVCLDGVPAEQPFEELAVADDDDVLALGSCIDPSAEAADPLVHLAWPDVLDQRLLVDLRRPLRWNRSRTTQ
eukprot:2189017-Pleurochrysis_carterae.AAC.1